MRILQFNEHCEDILSEVATTYEVDKEKLWEMYLGIMKSNYFEDLCDIARENKFELKGEIKKMKYLAVMHECYVRDNNTPSDKIWAKVVEFKSDKEKREAEDKYLEEYKEDEAYEATIEFMPLEDFSEWVKVGEVW